MLLLRKFPPKAVIPARLFKASSDGGCGPLDAAFLDTVHRLHGGRQQLVEPPLRPLGERLCLRRGALPTLAQLLSRRKNQLRCIPSLADYEGTCLERVGHGTDVGGELPDVFGVVGQRTVGDLEALLQNATDRLLPDAAIQRKRIL